MIISLITGLFKVVTIILSFFDDNQNYKGYLPIFYTLFYKKEDIFICKILFSILIILFGIILYIILISIRSIIYYIENKVFYGIKKCFTK